MRIVFHLLNFQSGQHLKIEQFINKMRWGERVNAMCLESDYRHKREHTMLSKNVVLIGTFLLKASKGEL